MPRKVGSQAARPRPSPTRRTSLQKSPLASGSLAPRPTTTSAVRAACSGSASTGAAASARAQIELGQRRVDAERPRGGEGAAGLGDPRGVERQR